jgi:hypothetical protein
VREQQRRESNASGMDHVAAYRAYGELSGVLVGFVVASLAVVFSIVPRAGEADTLGRVVIQLCLGLLAGTVAALSLLTLSAYPLTDAHVAAAHLLVLPPAVCGIAVMGAFEELARAFLPEVSGFLVFTIACLAGLVILPNSFDLPGGWRPHLMAVFSAWLLFILILLGKVQSWVWTPSTRSVAAITLGGAVIVALAGFLAFVKVAHEEIYRSLPWDEDAEKIASFVLLTLASAGLLLALLPPPG